MMSVMSSSNVDRVVPLPGRGSTAVGEEKDAASTTKFGSAEALGFGTVASTDEAARVGAGGSEETSCGNVSDSRVLKLENAETRFRGSGGTENQPSSSVSRLHGKLEHKKDRSAIEDYDSLLSAFDLFAAEGDDEAVGHGFRIGDMVWGKVKSHPWWPGLIYNEALASPSVRRGKHVGHHVLVAFFGDSSYGWFDPEELIPLEENFAEKARQTTSRSFLKAVEEAGEEIARRSSLALTCRCRNEFNFRPSSAEGYFVVDVGDPELGVYSLGQIRKAQDDFRPREVVSFLHKAALQPMNEWYCSVDFIKQKAAALALRKAFFEEFDETYAQAFGSQLTRPSRPTALGDVDPSKAPLSGRLVIAEALGKGKISVQPSKTRGQEKNKYLLNRQEESIQIRNKKASSSKVGQSTRPLLVDGQHSGLRDYMHQASESRFANSQQVSIDAKPSESSRKFVEGGTKKVKFPKQPAGESTAEIAIRIKKKKKGISLAIGGELRALPLAPSDSALMADYVSVTPVHVEPSDKNGLEDQKTDVAVGFTSSQSQQELDFAKIELQMLVADLRALALNPFHGEQKSCPAVIKEVFLKFRILVYQKSLVSMPPARSEASDNNSSRLPAPALVVSPTDKTNHKIVKPSVRLDDPTKGGKKRGLSDRTKDVQKSKLNVSEGGRSDRPKDVQKRKFDVFEGVKRKKVDDSLNSKKKKISSTVEQKIIPRSAEYQLGDLKDNAIRVVPPTLQKAVKQESSKRTGQMVRAANPTMLVMKFPSGAALPSIPQLKAKFARFGPLDHLGTRVFWKTYTCRLLYQHKIDAQAALKFAVGSNLFGNPDVRYFLREVEGEGADSEPAQPQKEDTSPVGSQAKEPAVEQRGVAKTASQPQSSAQLKSCLKKPSRDEGGNGGGGRGARVKFVLGGGEVPLNESKKNNIAIFPQGASTNSKILSSNTFTPTPHISVKPPPAPQTSGGPPSTATDISQKMLNLLLRCSDVINDLNTALGRRPYHPL